MKNAHISTINDKNIELTAMIDYLKLQVKENEHSIEAISDNLELRNASMDYVNDM